MEFMMSKWIERFNSHPIIGVWNNLLQIISDEKILESATEDSAIDIARLRKVVAYLNGVFENIDPEITPFNHLTNIQQSIQNCIKELNSYKGNKNPGHLTNANANADSLIIQFQQLPSSNHALSEENIRASVSAYSETIGAYISKYKNETESSVKSLLSDVESLKNSINDKELKLADLNKQVETVEQTIQKQTSEFNTQYQTSEKSRSDQFQKQLDSYISKFEDNIEQYSEKSDEEFTSLSTKTGKIIEVLTNLQDDASKVYGVTINTLQAGAYSSYANDERKIANRYRIYASILMILGVSFLVLPEARLIFENSNYSFEWMKVVGRVPLSLVVFVPAFYFAKESGKHRTNEVTNRRRQHILTTLDPYIELMKEENAESLRVHVAKTVFSEEAATKETKDSDASNLLSQLANLAKQIKGG